jgi:hypothetical protein
MRPAGVIGTRAPDGFGSVMGMGQLEENRRQLADYPAAWPSAGGHACPDIP